MEQARGDVLTDGKFTLAGEGNLYMEADFGVPANHFVSPGIRGPQWRLRRSSRTLRAWIAVYVATNGFRPGGFVCSETTLGYMLQSAEIRTLASSLVGAPSIVSEAQLAAVLPSRSGCRSCCSPTTRRSTSTGTSTPGPPGGTGHLRAAEPSPTSAIPAGRHRDVPELVNSREADLSFLRGARHRRRRREVRPALPRVHLRRRGSACRSSRTRSSSWSGTCTDGQADSTPTSTSSTRPTRASSRAGPAPSAPTTRCPTGRSRRSSTRTCGPTARTSRTKSTTTEVADLRRRLADAEAKLAEQAPAGSKSRRATAPAPAADRGRRTPRRTASR